MPSPHYRAGRSATLTKGIWHTTEGAQSIEALGAWFGNPSSGVSSHHGADNIKRGIFGAYVYEQNTAWTQGNANGFCVSIELCTPVGASANWSRAYWLANYDTLLWNAAEWTAYIAKKYGLPLVALGNSDAQNPAVKGFAQHKNLGAMGSGHVDCGNMPFDVVLQRAKTFNAVKPPVTGGKNMNTTAVAMYKGGAYHACIGTTGKIYFKTPTSGWVNIDPAANPLVGVDMDIDPDTGLVIISYANQEKNVCTYQQPVADYAKVPWKWTNRGGTVALISPPASKPPVKPPAFTVVQGADYSYDRPDLKCLKAQGVTFVMRYASRTAAKNLTAAELTSIRSNGLKVGLFWQEGKTQMLRGAAGGTQDAKEADAFGKSLGLAGMPFVFACDFDPVASQWPAIDAYMNAVKAYLGLARTGGYGGQAFIKRQFDAGRMKYGVQTYAWSGSPTVWDSRAQLRQVKNDQTVCGGKIDWEEQRSADAPLRS